jgi:predicted secreted Zn-dependent protease
MAQFLGIKSKPLMVVVLILIVVSSAFSGATMTVLPAEAKDSDVDAFTSPTYRSMRSEAVDFILEANSTGENSGGLSELNSKPSINSTDTQTSKGTLHEKISKSPSYSINAIQEDCIDFGGYFECTVRAAVGDSYQDRAQCSAEHSEAVLQNVEVQHIPGSIFTADPPGNPTTYTFLWENIRSPGTYVEKIDCKFVVCPEGFDCIDSPPITYTIIVNSRPVADAGGDQEVKSGDTVTLDGSKSSDNDGDQLTYEWTQNSGTPVVLSDSAAVQPTFIAPDVDEKTDLEFQLIVGDGMENSDSDTVTVTIESDKCTPASLGSFSTFTTSNDPCCKGSTTFPIDGKIIYYEIDPKLAPNLEQAVKIASNHFTLPDGTKAAAKTYYVFNLVGCEPDPNRNGAFLAFHVVFSIYMEMPNWKAPCEKVQNVWDKGMTQLAGHERRHAEKIKSFFKDIHLNKELIGKTEAEAKEIIKSMEPKLNDEQVKLHKKMGEGMKIRTDIKCSNR